MEQFSRGGAGVLWLAAALIFGGEISGILAGAIWGHVLAVVLVGASCLTVTAAHACTRTSVRISYELGYRHGLRQGYLQAQTHDSSTATGGGMVVPFRDTAS